jgi:hypothetical protein
MKREHRENDFPSGRINRPVGTFGLIGANDNHVPPPLDASLKPTPTTQRSASVGPAKNRQLVHDGTVPGPSRDLAIGSVSVARLLEP